LVRAFKAKGHKTNRRKTRPVYMCVCVYDAYKFWRDMTFTFYVLPPFHKVFFEHKMPHTNLLSNTSHILRIS